MPANLFLTLNLQDTIADAVLEFHFDSMEFVNAQKSKKLNAGCVEIRTDGSSAQFGFVSKRALLT